MRHVHIHVTGIVQGVGMRPFVYREAMAHGICGWVLNAGDGVHIEAHARAEAVDGFVAALSEHAPAAARVERVDIADLKPSGWSAADEQGFRIVASQDQTAHTTLVSPDIATCDDCLRELFDPADRRYHYPFINCTNCGPRFTIIRSLPYDRAATSMNCFPMCPECAAEYADPLDRRFHAQPDACFDCGPHITWREAGVGDGRDEAAASPAVGTTRETSDAIIDRCVELLACGGIVAIKGLGGFHLACDASNEQAVAELRRRKRRSNKPLAVMVRDLADAERLCHVNDVERGLLAGSIRPIVLLRRRAVCERGDSPDALALAPSVAHDLSELGVMLPYAPLQHLLLAAAAARGMHALVMTSGNLSEEPIETDDDLAWEHLVAAGIADALLGNDRAILSRYDDSVARVVDGAVMPVRRARGYAPQPLPLPALDGTPSCVLACGPQQKATIALTREGANGEATCFVSQHIGDVENGGTFDAWNAARTRLEDLFDLAPAALACDLHPSYLSSQWAREQARKCNLPLVEVQHHHAHIASVMAEAIAAGQLATDARVLGIAFDGDADRCLACDEKGQEIDGDKVIALLAMNMKEKGCLDGNTAVVTVMSNLGFIKFMESQGIRTEKTAVGDRYVLEEMLKHDYSIGGEQSGHIIFPEFNTTGDGLITAVQTLKVLRESGKTMSELNHLMVTYPQILKNVEVYSKNGWEDNELIRDSIRAAEEELGSDGRILVRASGTEPLIRVMGEGKEINQLERIIDDIASVVEHELGVENN